MPIPRPKRRGRLDANLPEDMVTSDLHWGYREALYRFLERDTVSGVSLGDKIVNGKAHDQMCVRVHVREKLPESVLTRREIFPPTISGIPVDVVQRNYAAEGCGQGQAVFRRRILNPIQPGVEIGRADTAAGTFGLVVFEVATGQPCLLSAAHVIAPKGSAEGDPIIQPGFRSLGKVDLHTIATLGRSVLGSEGDIAYARLTGTRAVNLKQMGTEGARVTGVRKPTKGEIVTKSGRTTCVTRGIVESCCGQIEYKADDQILRMEGFEIRPVQDGNPDDEEISEKGDSGSVWVDANGFAVGLHVAGETTSAAADERALACFLPDALQELGVQLEPTEETAPFPFLDAEAIGL